MPSREENRIHLEQTPIFDQGRLDEMKEAVGEETLEVLMRMLPEDVAAQFNALKSHFAAGDMHELMVAAHTVKGTAANLGAVRLQAVALMVEQAARDMDLTSVSMEMAEQVFNNTLAEVERTYG